MTILIRKKKQQQSNFISHLSSVLIKEFYSPESNAKHFIKTQLQLWFVQTLGTQFCPSHGSWSESLITIDWEYNIGNIGNNHYWYELGSLAVKPGIFLLCNYHSGKWGGNSLPQILTLFHTDSLSLQLMHF